MSEQMPERCPFCGAEMVNIHLASEEDPGDDFGVTWFEHPDTDCIMAGWEFDVGGNPETLIAWNSRYLAPGMVAVPEERLEKLRGWDLCCVDCPANSSCFLTDQRACGELIAAYLTAPTDAVPV